MANYERTAEQAAKLAKVEKHVSATIPCDDCGILIPYYDGKTLCGKCFALRVRVLEV